MRRIYDLLSSTGLNNLTVQPTFRKNPEYRLALLSPLRAIAFFSWEDRSRQFLVRRVYPTYFDFLTYSNVPEGWGALGSALREIEEGMYNEGANKVPKLYTSVKNVWREIHLLPYLEEAARLDYKAVIAVPIFESGIPSIVNLRGVFVFYLHDDTFFPKEDDKIQNARFRGFVRILAGSIAEHVKCLVTRRVIVPLTDLELVLGENYAGEVIIKVAGTGHPQPSLSRVVDEIASLLKGTDLFCLRKPAISEAQQTIAVSMRSNISIDFLRAKTYQAVGEALKVLGGEEYVSVQYKFKSGQ